MINFENRSGENIKRNIDYTCLELLSSKTEVRGPNFATNCSEFMPGFNKGNECKTTTKKVFNKNNLGLDRKEGKGCSNGSACGFSVDKFQFFILGKGKLSGKEREELKIITQNFSLHGK